MTLDDAAERREIYRKCTAIGESLSVRDAIDLAWAKATEAAAKKCDAEAEIAAKNDNIVYMSACLNCAAAIRGKD